MEGKVRQRFHRLSTRRFIPEGDKVARVLIHLLSFTFRRHGSQLGDTVFPRIESAPQILTALRLGITNIGLYVLPLGSMVFPGSP